MTRRCCSPRKAAARRSVTVFWPPSARRHGSGSGVRVSSVLEKRKTGHEAVRLLYVAATRARARLHLIGHARRYADESVRPRAGLCWSCCGPGSGKRSAGDLPAVLTPRARHGCRRPVCGVPLKRLPLAYAPPPFDTQPEILQSEPAISGRRPAPACGHGGPRGPSADRGRATEWLVPPRLAYLGVVPGELDEAVGKVVDAVSRTLASERGRWISRLTPRRETNTRSPA